MISVARQSGFTGRVPGRERERERERVRDRERGREFGWLLNMKAR